MRILLLSNSDYLLGLFKGYCLNSKGCEVKAITKFNEFYDEINNQPPLLIFIDFAHYPQLSGISEWQEAQNFIKKNHIILCGFGKSSPENQDIQANLIFEKIFPTTISEDEILIYLSETLIRTRFLKNDRRFGERRHKSDRRQRLPSINTSLPAKELQYSAESIKKGSLLINHSHRVISINDNPIDLSHKEFEIIDYLAANTDSVVKTEDIIKSVWQGYSRATKADVHQYIHMLRKKIEIDPHNPKILITIRGYGYELRP